jgi:GNAT superfamily N-acetyltransferase
MSGLAIRAADYSDLPRLAEISRNTWEGSDYLERVAASWISQGGLFVGTVDGVAVGTVKVTRLPAGVIWLEGLRVHPEHRSKGYGRHLVAYAAGLGRRAIESGEAETMEFATYVHNTESIAIASGLGFRAVEGFYILTHPGRTDAGAAVAAAESPERELSAMGPHLSAGWTFVRNTADGRRWLLDRTDARRCGRATFLVQRAGNCFVPLPAGLDFPGPLLDGIAAEARSRRLADHHVVIPEARRGLVRTLFEAGYESWEELEGPNMLVFAWSEA